MHEKMANRTNHLPTRTILLKSPDSNKVREVIITEIVVPDSSNKRISYINKMDSFTSKPNRKRRLDHLSVEEKILRKKLKNREAAQTSRDRKKARMEELEDTVKRLTQENESLCEDVLSLRDERDSLAKENTSLHEELWRLRVEGVAPTGPAVSFANSPLPKGLATQSARYLPLLEMMSLQLDSLQARKLVLPMLKIQLFLLLLTPISLILTGLQSAVPQVWMTSKVSQTLSTRKHYLWSSQNHKKKPWWGRYQKAWNPVEMKETTFHRVSQQLIKVSQ